MKKLIISLLVTTAASFVTPALADPITHPVEYVCPNANILGNFGTYIGGTGSEILSARTTNSVYFQSKKTLTNVPSSLSNYTNAATNYDGPTGNVTCSYKSSNPAESDFDITYAITNGKGGKIQTRTANTIDIVFFVG